MQFGPPQSPLFGPTLRAGGGAHLSRRMPQFALPPTTCASCASIVGRYRCPVSFQSESAEFGLEVLAPDGRCVHKGRMPQSMTFDAHKGFFQRAKCVNRSTGTRANPIEARLDASLDPWHFCHILFGGLIGILIVDPLTSAMWKLPHDFVLRAPGLEAGVAERAALTPRS